MRPVVCMVTSPAGEPVALDALVERVAVAAHAGVHLVQVRQLHLDGGPLMDVVRRCLDAVRGTATRVVVNDRVDVAVTAGAHGVHLRGQSMPAMRVREVVSPGFLIGRSVHSQEEARTAVAAGGLDYLIAGTIFETLSKPGIASVGVGLLSVIVQAVPIPVLAIGGVTLDTIPAVASSGAAGFAAIGLFEQDEPAVLRQVVQLASRWCDTPGTLT